MRFLRRAKLGQLSRRAVDRTTLAVAVVATLGYVFYRSLPMPLLLPLAIGALAVLLATLPSSVAQIRQDWQIVASLKHRARILDAHASELDGADAEQLVRAVLDSSRRRLEAGGHEER